MTRVYAIDAAERLGNGSAKRKLKPLKPGVQPGPHYLELVNLLLQPAECPILVPKRYFDASNELMVLTLLVTWSITLAYDWRLAWDHPARKYVGHMNPCFGWDYRPASIVAVFACAADVHLAWTYAATESLRTRLRSRDGRLDWAESFSLLTTRLHGAAAMIWMLLWLVGPPDGRWAWHLAIFSIAIFFRYLCALGNYIECRFGSERDQVLVEKSHTVFIVTYGVVTVLLPILYFTDIFVYRAQGRVGVDPPIPWYILQTMDVVWCAHLALCTKFSIPEPPILLTRKVVEYDVEIDADEYDFTPQQVQIMERLGFRVIE